MTFPLHFFLIKNAISKQIFEHLLLTHFLINCYARPGKDGQNHGKKNEKFPEKAERKNGNEGRGCAMNEKDYLMDYTVTLGVNYPVLTICGTTMTLTNCDSYKFTDPLFNFVAIQRLTLSELIKQKKKLLELFSMSQNYILQKVRRMHVCYSSGSGKHRSNMESLKFKMYSLKRHRSRLTDCKDNQDKLEKSLKTSDNSDFTNKKLL
ncbi:hypothetical protein CAEBREN_10167 [Caenorhabditis brenneri]|uniref:Uncharacterized protein n=1 Tax=Caenorhabditis brenneri TaxID=135651 RepID=G0NPP6_CAEBE|nr:hypothetical protein CAEBREN_10167 [Caenorhabditis brenneri]